MSEWELYTLGKDVVTKLGDGLHGTPIYDDNGEYYFINGSNLVEGKIVINSNTKKVTQEEFVKYKKDLSDKTILLGINGTIGNVALYNNEMCILGKSAAYLNINDAFDKQFVRYVLTNDHFQNYIKNNASGTTIKNVGLGLLRDYEFLAPIDKVEQQQIAQILTSLDDKIELNLQMNQTLEAMAQALFKKWFEEKDIDNLKEITFGDFVKPQKGKNITKSDAIFGDIPVVAGGLEPSCYHNESNTQAPVITISSSGANAGFVRLYHTPVWSSDSCYIDSSLFPYIYFCYIFLKLNQKRIYDSQEGSAQPHIYPRHIMALSILNYDNELIQKFETIATSIFEKIKYNSNQIQTLTQTRDTLLPKLMTDKIIIKE